MHSFDEYLDAQTIADLSSQLIGQKDWGHLKSSQEWLEYMEANVFPYTQQAISSAVEMNFILSNYLQGDQSCKEAFCNKYDENSSSFITARDALEELHNAVTSQCNVANTGNFRQMLHTARNHLTGIITHLGLVKLDFDSNCKKHAGIIQTSLEQLRIISPSMLGEEVRRCVLGYTDVGAKIVKGDIAIEDTLGHVLEKVAQEQKEIIKAHEYGIDIEVKIRDDANSVYIPQQARQVWHGVIAELVTNSIKAFVESDSLRNRKGTITIRAYIEDDGLLVDVMDDGPGIAEEDQAKVFSDFTTRRSGGGIGLSAAQATVEGILNGAIGIKTKEAPGCHVEICVGVERGLS